MKSSSPFGKTKKSLQTFTVSRQSIRQKRKGKHLTRNVLLITQDSTGLTLAIDRLQWCFTIAPFFCGAHRYTHTHHLMATNWLVAT